MRIIVTHHCDEAKRTAKDKMGIWVQCSFCPKAQGQRGKLKMALWTLLDTELCEYCVKQPGNTGKPVSFGVLHSVRLLYLFAEALTPLANQ